MYRKYKGLPLISVFCQWLIAFCFLSFSGCSEIQAPTPKEALSHPFGTSAPFLRGTPKAKVLADWGKPDYVNVLGVDELGTVREEWIYHGRIQNLPIDYRYVSRTKRLFFEGEALVNWKTDEPTG